MSALPDWLGKSAPRGPCPLAGARAPRSFAERTLVGLARLVADEASASREAARPGFLQAADARAKLVAASLLLVAIAGTPSIVALAALGALAPALAAASRVDARRYARRVWLSAPLFSAGVALPALFSSFSPGETAIALGPFVVTREGIEAATRLVLRVGASVSVALLLARTTAPPALLKALRALGVPRAMVLVAAMTHRYIFLLAREVEEMHLGLVSRRIAPLAAPGARAWVGSRLGVLFEKANRTAEEVHLAMAARGFRGEWRTLDRARFGAREAVLIAAAAALAAGIALAGRAGLL